MCWHRQDCIIIWKSSYLYELSDATIAQLITHAAGITSPMSGVDIHHMQGAVSRIGEEDTGFATGMRSLR